MFFGNPHGRVSVKSTVLPIWTTDSFRPARVRLIDGMAELLLGLDIVMKLDITVVFGIDHFRVGQGELEMMTYNEKHHWALPLLPTACAYAKLRDYFRKIQKEQIEILQVQGDFGGHLGVRKVTKAKAKKIQGGVEDENRLFRKWKMRYKIRLREC